ncbi:uncharacterized protein LOC134227584 [Armigeres subalbatus]|uniref:uncharacterized protein LOC134227584 n=1 Tax=Armigeres subalbatus TaxID=124917 RepID=UPI002ED0190C
MAHSAGMYVRAPNRAKETNSSKELSRELAGEKAMNTVLASELEQSRREIEELKGIIYARDNRHPSESPSLDFEIRNGFSSTGRTEANSNFVRSVDDSKFLSSMTHLSLASINVPECKATDGEDLHRQIFEQWIDLLIDTMKLAGIDDEATRFTVFKVKAGSRLLSIFRNTKSSEDAPDVNSLPFSNAVHRLRTYFGSGSDIMLMRRRLALMIQKPDESDLTFISRVGTIARLCEFEEEKEFEEIVATVAEHARSREVRTTALKMLSRKGSFTDLVDKVREIEAIRLNEEYVKQKIGNQSHALIAPITTGTNHADNRQQQFRGKPYYRGFPLRRGNWRAPRGRQPYFTGGSRSKESEKRWPYGFEGSQAQEGERCWRCYSVFHSETNCKVKDKYCNRCGVMGHIQRACPKANYSSLKRSGQEQTDAPPYKIAAVEETNATKSEEGPATDSEAKLSTIDTQILSQENPAQVSRNPNSVFSKSVASSSKSFEVSPITIDDMLEEGALNIVSRTNLFYNLNIYLVL